MAKPERLEEIRADIQNDMIYFVPVSVAKELIEHIDELEAQHSLFLALIEIKMKELVDAFNELKERLADSVPLTQVVVPKMDERLSPSGCLASS